MDRFSSRLTARGAELAESTEVFDEDYSDSDGDGFSNLFERSMGLDSPPENPEYLPFKVKDTTDGRQ